MKRFAAHYLFLPEVGFIKQQVVELTIEGTIGHVFTLREELESVEWFPGVIALISESDIEQAISDETFLSNHPIVGEQASLCVQDIINGYKRKGVYLLPILLYPFDFITMQPVSETQRKLLR